MPDLAFHLDLDRVPPDHDLWDTAERWEPDWRRFDPVLAPRAIQSPVSAVAFPSPWSAALAVAWLIHRDLGDHGPFGPVARRLGLAAIDRRPRSVLFTEDDPFALAPPDIGWALAEDLTDLLGDRRAKRLVAAMGPSRFWDLGDVVVFADAPLGRSLGDLAVWADGWNVHLVSGWSVPRSVAHDPSLVTPERVLAEPNAERRRILFELVDPAAFASATGGRVVDSDAFGTLWQTLDPSGREEHARFVEVADATPRTDGSRRHYWLRVPPDVATARAAVAWTFGLDPGDYRPTIET